jgi:hypothetical protein
LMVASVAFFVIPEPLRSSRTLLRPPSRDEC